MALTLEYSNSLVTPKLQLKPLLILAATVTARIESPPLSKNPSSTSTFSLPRTSLQISATRLSIPVFGATPTARLAGYLICASRLRSTLPFGVSGIVSGEKNAGIM